jgi:hypothetical protein
VVPIAAAGCRKTSHPTPVTSKRDFVQSCCCGPNNGHEFCSCSTILAKESEVRGFGHDRHDVAGSARSLIFDRDRNK